MIIQDLQHQLIIQNQMNKKVHLQMKVKVALHLLAFQNINMFTKGIYKIKIESFTTDQYCHTELAEQEKQQLQLTKFTKTQVFTKDFQIHYQNQKVQLNQLVIIKTPILKFDKQIKLFARLSLLKKEKQESDTEKNQFNHLTESIVIVRFLQNSLCQYYQCNFQQPFLSSLSLLFLCQPIKITIEIKIYKHASEEELLALKKQVKKLRYNNYLLYNKYKKIMYNQIKYEFSLPKLFVNGDEQMIEVVTNQQKLLNYLILYETSSLTPEQMNYQLISIAQKNQVLFTIFTENCQKMGIFTNKLKMESQDKKIKMHKQFIIKQIYKQRFCQENRFVVKQKLKLLQRELQLGNNDQLLNNLQLQMQNIYQQSKLIELPIFPIILHQTQKRKTLDKTTKGDKQEPHLKTRYVFILAHGYHGCPDDLKLLANGFKKRFRKSRYMILKSYQNKMNQEMKQIIKSAVDQITQYLNTLDFEEKQYKLVMVGHSMGGLILRGAANQIPYTNNLFCYISLGTPHLGYLQGIKLIIRAGLSLFSNLYNTPCLNQLSNKDNSELHNCFMYKLSQIGNLSNFKRVILVSSVHDKFVSWHSARLEMFNKDRLQQFNFIEKQMIDRILPKLSKIERIDRLQTDFKLQNNNVDTFLGRTSHIKLLNDLQFIELLANACLPSIFQD